MITINQIRSIYQEAIFSRKSALYVKDDDEQLSFIKRYLPSNCDVRILDAACGNGRYMRKLGELGYRHIWGIDLFTGIGMSNYVCASIEALPLLGNCMDMIYSNSAIFYLERPIESLQEFFRVLRSGGYVIITAHSKYSLFTLDRVIRMKLKPNSVQHLMGVSFYSSLEYKRKMEKAGFEVVEMDGYRLSYFVWPAIRKLLKLTGTYHPLGRSNSKKRNKTLAFLRSIFCYHAVLVGCKRKEEKD